MATKIAIHHLNGSVIFEFEKENNTIKDTVEEAVRQNVNLSYANLYGANLKGANLCKAKLMFACFIDANLNGANLSDANLSMANLSDANLINACLKNADLSHSYLSDAELNNANLTNAILYKTTLINTNLTGVILRGTKVNQSNLYNACLKKAVIEQVESIGSIFNEASITDVIIEHSKFSGSIFDEANFTNSTIKDTQLFGASFVMTCFYLTKFVNAIVKMTNFSSAIDIFYAKNIPHIPFACPSDGAFIGWKKVICGREIYLVKLLIPEDARRCSATTNKCRCDKAKVLEITNIKTGEKVNKVLNANYVACTYFVGEMVYPDSFNGNRWNECSHGIHFFINKQDAIYY